MHIGAKYWIMRIHFTLFFQLNVNREKQFDTVYFEDSMGNEMNDVSKDGMNEAGAGADAGTQIDDLPEEATGGTGGTTPGGTTATTQTFEFVEPPKVFVKSRNIV